jgi:predicted nuclease of predicted toxin-antitoxin system
MKFVIDMNLSPAWCEALKQAGHEAVHWSEVGDPKATDATVMAWATDHEAVVFTHDLDFSAMLAASGGRGPSVLQVRAEDVLPEGIGKVTLSAIRQHEQALVAGAIVVVEPWRTRSRVLPLRRD